ncbi:MAG: mannitol dehydrogenase family protein [Burkholderiaceae bacterium]
MSIASATALSLASLDRLDPEVGLPRYQRADLSPGIVHFGPGNFHRVHQAVYLDALMNMGQALDWGLIGVSVMRGDEDQRNKLLAQDWLTTVVAQSASEKEARVTGPMLDYRPIADSAAILVALTDPRIRIVSLTVTEGGYFIDTETGGFNEQDRAIQEDLNHPQHPSTVFGLIVRALAMRRESGHGPFTVMSCDNLPHNGVIARNAVLGMARLIDLELAQWIEQSVSFPSGMVDRIAPATGDRELQLVRAEYGIADQAPVYCEDYLQWVLEDNFVAGRPPLEQVGVQFVDDVTPYETMKVRILNGGHALIAYAAGLLDIEFASDAMTESLIQQFLDKVEREEVLTVVPPVPDTDLTAYLKLIQTRFANPSIGDTVRRLCLDGSNRQPKFIIPTICDQIAVDGPVRGLALASALWCRYCAGTTESGANIEPNDPAWDHLQKVAYECRQRPEAWLEMRDVYGDLVENQAFKHQFTAAIEALWRDGIRQTLAAYVND